MAKKTKLNIDKGLKRIFKVIAPLWGIFLVLAAMINWDKLEPILDQIKEAAINSETDKMFELIKQLVPQFDQS